MQTEEEIWATLTEALKKLSTWGWKKKTKHAQWVISYVTAVIPQEPVKHLQLLTLGTDAREWDMLTLFKLSRWTSDEVSVKF